MKVTVEREVNLDRLIEHLDVKSQMNLNGMAGYEVVVDKQLLIDAHDVIVQFRKEALERETKDMEDCIKRYKKELNT